MKSDISSQRETKSKEGADVQCRGTVVNGNASWGFFFGT